MGLNYRNGAKSTKTDEKIEIAKKMLAKGKSMEEIMELTNLSVEQLENIA